MREVTWRRRALTDLETIARHDQRQAERIRDGVARYAEDQGDVVKMKAGSEVYRLRVGDWRILFSLEEGGRVMLVQRVLNRRDAYR